MDLTRLVGARFGDAEVASVAYRPMDRTALVEVRRGSWAVRVGVPVFPEDYARDVARVALDEAARLLDHFRLVEEDRDF